MKKFLSIIALAAVFTACSNSETPTVNTDSVIAVDTTVIVDTTGAIVDTIVNVVEAPAAH